MEGYCSALLSQEKSLEELQRHLRNTEELFRESVKRKNQQLDLLQSEVRRLKTSVAGRDEQANAQIESALGAQAAELRRTKELLVTRDADIEHLTKQLEAAKMELAIERTRREQDSELADNASIAEGELKKRDEELQGVRLQLQQAQQAAARLQAASKEAEEAIKARDAELQSLREKQETGVNTSAERQMLTRELQLLRAKCDEIEAKLAKAEDGRAEAEAWARYFCLVRYTCFGEVVAESLPMMRRAVQIYSKISLKRRFVLRMRPLSWSVRMRHSQVVNAFGSLFTVNLSINAMPCKKRTSRSPISLSRHRPHWPRQEIDRAPA